MIGYQTRVLSITEGCTVWGVSNSAAEQKSRDRPRTELEAIKQVSTFITFHTAGTWKTIFSVDFRLMTGCRLMGTQVNGTKVQHQIRTRDPAGFVEKKTKKNKETGLLKYKAGCLKTKGTQISTVKSCSLLPALLTGLWHGMHDRTDS